MKFLANLTKSFHLCLSNPWYLAWAVVFDLLHAFSFMQILTTIWIQVAEKATAIQDIFTGINLETPEQAMTAEMVQFLAQQHQVIQAHYNEMTALLFTLALAAFGLWALFQGGSWWLAHKIVKDKLERKQFIPRFLIITLLTQALLFLVMYGTSFVNYLLTVEGPLQSEQAFTPYLLGAGTLSITYLQFLAYCVIGNKSLWNGFIRAVKNIKRLLPAYGIALLILFAVNALAAMIASLDIAIGFLLTVLFTVPAVTFLRVYLIETTRIVR